MHDISDDSPGGITAPGTTIEERIHHWRQQTWHELCDVMTPPRKGAQPPAARLDATPVQVSVVIQQAG
jgi:hypothetical protein